MRVISGKFKGKRLFSPDDNRIRPTTDRIKETIFNILNSLDAINNARVLDLFCGSGALGIEALSRGAIQVIFADIDKNSVALAKKNLEHVGAAKTPDATEVYLADYRLALKKLEGRQFDLIFIDPPYGSKPTFDCLNLIDAHNILSKNGVIVFEHSASISLPNPQNRYIIDTRQMGDTHVSFITRNKNIDSKD